MSLANSSFEDIIERISDAFIALDKNWCYTYVNKKAGQIFDRDPKQLVGKHIWTEFPEGVGKPFQKAYEKAMQEQKYIYLQEYYDPYDLWFENHIYPSPNGLSIYFRDITERKKTEDTIKESEEKFRSLFEQASDSIAITDHKGNILQVNDSFLKLIGYEKGDISGLTLNDIIPQEEISSNPPQFEKLKAGEKLIYERRMKKKDGTIILAEINTKMGTNGLLVVFIRDITVRKKQKDELLNSMQRNAAFLKALPDVIFVFNKDGVFTDYNNPLGGETFTAPETFLQKTVFEILPPELADETMQKLKLVFEKGESPVHQYQLAYADGNRHFEGRYAKINENEVLVIVRDITQQKKDEQELAEKENRLRTIIDLEPECVKLLGPQGQLLDMNSAGLAMIEAENLDKVKGKIINYLINEKYRSHFIELTNNVFKGQSGKLEFELTGIKGTKRWMDTHAVPMRDAEGKIISMLSITRDITEQKKGEEKVKQLNEELEQRVKERTAELEIANENLQELNDLFVGNEITIYELKEELRKLKKTNND